MFVITRCDRGIQIPIVIPDSDRESRNVVALRLDRLSLPVTIYFEGTAR